MTITAPPTGAASDTDRAAAHREQDRTAERLLRSAAKLSIDPQTEIDWDAPLEPGRYYAPPHRSSLYGTYLWEQLSEDQRIELTKHEVASIASVGIYFEEILMQMLLRYAYDRDLTRPHVQWALTEIADECRHSIMFASMIEKFGSRNFGVDRVPHELGRVFKAISDGTQTFAGTMYVEEILDALQRETMDDESLQPLVRTVSRTHVIEESRHISYAREESLRVWSRKGRLGRAYDRLLIGLIIYYATTRLVHADVYAMVGLDPVEARRVASTNPYWTKTKTFAAAKVLKVFDDMGLIGRENRWLLHKAGVLG